MFGCINLRGCGRNNLQQMHGPNQKILAVIFWSRTNRAPPLKTSVHVAVDWSRRLRSGYVWGHGKFSDSKEPLFGTRRTFRRSGTAATCHAKLDEFLQVMYGHILVWVWVVRCGRPTIDLHNARTCRCPAARMQPNRFWPTLPCNIASFSPL